MQLTRLSPSYFAVVMATGIVSLAARMLEFSTLAFALFLVNLALYVALTALHALRVFWHPHVVLQDLSDHLRGPGFFTSVAATSVVGSQCVVLAKNLGLGVALLAVAGALWLGFIYAIFAALVVKEEKPPLDRGISGAWLLTTVATQSIAALSTLVATQVVPPSRLVLDFLALCMWLCGGTLYVWTISLIFYRYAFFRLAPADLSPTYWINMGAMAISTLAGSLLVVNAVDDPFLLALLPFLKGVTILCWATGTWWIPLLLILGAWRYLYKRYPLRYDPSYWAVVFPLGMYAASTKQMAEAIALPFLRPVSYVFLYLALVAWALTFAGLAQAALHAAGRLRGDTFLRE